MTSIADSLRRSESVLAESGIAEPGREAVSLVMLATEHERTFIYAYPEYELATDEVAKLDTLLERRARREPLQYISGVQEFFGLEFDISPDVLIPRPETEMVVEHAIEFLHRRENPRFCEIGVGSGCISVSILFNLPECAAIGTDVSNAALGIAERNSTKHNVADRLRLIESDVFGAIPEQQFDMIVSNPPYIPLSDVGTLQEEVRLYEPHVALTDRRDGLSIVRRIIAGAPEFLRPGGALLIEIGFDQAEQVRAMFASDKWTPAVLFPDLQGIPRVVFAERL